MKNQELAEIFNEIANFLEMEGVAFKPYAYQKAAIILQTLEKDIEEIYEKGGRKALLNIPGVGKSIADKIEEYLKTGKIKYLEELKKKTPVEIEQLADIEGLGPKKIKFLYEKLKIKTVKQLEEATKKHKIAGLFGFGEKTEKNILQGIEFLKRNKGRFLLGEILPKAEEILTQLKNLKEVEEISFAGSIRRMKETIGDIDILAISSQPKKVMNFFTSLPGIIKIWGRGTTKSSIRLKEGFDVDLRVIPKISYGAALQYFTGSKEHNIVLRKIAIDKGYKLNEYGLFKGKKMIGGKTEEEIYKILGLVIMPPELREDKGEIEAALRQARGEPDGLPKIIDQKDIKGDLHCHSNWNGGANSLEELAFVAQKMGYQYLGIADHTKFLRIEHGLDEKKLAIRNQAIDKLNKNFKSFRLLKGCEANIMNDGTIDIADETLKQLDFVIAGIHSNFKMNKQEMTKRIINALKNPHVDIISHPTGRLINRRDEYQIDLEKIFKAAKDLGKVLEINSFPERLDLNDNNIRRAKEMGVKMMINTDAHHKDQLRYIRLGVAQARRGWAEKKDIINTNPIDKLLMFFQHTS